MKKRIFALLALTVLCLSLFTACSKSGVVTAEQAQKIALDHAGLKESEVTSVHSHIVEHEGLASYNIHFTCADGEFSYIISAADGAILEYGEGGHG